MIVNVVIARHTPVATTVTYSNAADSKPFVAYFNCSERGFNICVCEFGTSFYYPVGMSAQRVRLIQRSKRPRSDILNLHLGCVPPLSVAMEFPEGCSPCNTKRLVAEQEAEDARNGRQRRH